MKKVLIGFVFLLAFIPLNASTIKGRCINEEGNPVEYAMIGIEGVNMGMVADRQGYFTLNIPDSLQGYRLVFSHISYNPESFLISDLLEKYERAVASGSILTVELSKYIFAIEPVVVTGKKLRLTNINSRGIRIPAGWWWHVLPWLSESDQPDSRNQEFGIMTELKGRTWVRRIELDVQSNSFDTMVLQLSMYKIDGDDYVPLMQAPYYLKISRNEAKQNYTCDLSDFNIVAEGSVYIGMVIVEESAKGQLVMPAYFSSSYFRNMSTGLVKKNRSQWGF